MSEMLSSLWEKTLRINSVQYSVAYTPLWRSVRVLPYLAGPVQPQLSPVVKQPQSNPTRKPATVQSIPPVW